jgi:ribonuclease P protein component
MLSQRRRIPRKLFKPIIDKGRYYNTDHFSLRAAVPEGEVARVAVSVSKKTARKAVLRNLMRRRVYSSVRDLLPSLKPGLYLVVAKPGVVKVKGEDLNKELQQLFSKV